MGMRRCQGSAKKGLGIAEAYGTVLFWRYIMIKRTFMKIEFMIAIIGETAFANGKRRPEEIGGVIYT
jgi:hypothetical protein